MPLHFNWDGPVEFLFDSVGGKMSCPHRRDLPWNDYDRMIYMLQLMPPYYVSYKSGKSAVCYIGQGSNALRVISHNETWFHKVAIILENFKGFYVWGCQPRQRNSLNAYKKVEGDALELFKDTFGERPLFNQRGGSWSEHTYSDEVDRDTRRIFSLDEKKGYSVAIRSLATRKVAG